MLWLHTMLAAAYPTYMHDDGARYLTLSPQTTQIDLTMLLI